MSPKELLLLNLIKQSIGKLIFNFFTWNTSKWRIGKIKNI